MKADTKKKVIAVFMVCMMVLVVFVGAAATIAKL